MTVSAMTVAYTSDAGHTDVRIARDQAVLHTRRADPVRPVMYMLFPPTLRPLGMQTLKLYGVQHLDTARTWFTEHPDGWLIIAYTIRDQSPITRHCVGRDS